MPPVRVVARATARARQDNALQNSAARNLSIGTFNGDVKLGLGKAKL